LEGFKNESKEDTNTNNGRTRTKIWIDDPIVMNIAASIDPLFEEEMDMTNSDIFDIKGKITMAIKVSDIPHCLFISVIVPEMNSDSKEISIEETIIIIINIIINAIFFCGSLYEFVKKSLLLMFP